MDKYLVKYIKMIKQWNKEDGSQEDLALILDKIYQDGFEDGANN